MWNSKMKRRLSDYPNRSPCWSRQLTTPLGRRAGGRKEPELRSQAMGSQVLRPAVFPDVLVRTRHPWRMPWRVFVLEHLERWWTVSWDPRHQFAAYLNRDVHFTWSDFKQLRKLWGISRKRRNCLFPQARKHCRNGDADTDCDWDNKQNENGKVGKTENRIKRLKTMISWSKQR